MLKNYLKISFREIYNNKIFSIIHILGVAIGIAAFLLILRYAQFELSYDNFYKNADNIYRVRQDRYDKGKLSTTWGAGCAAIGPALKKEFPEVIDYARLSNVNGIITTNQDKFREEKIFAANTSFLTIFPVKLIGGIDTSALNDPYTAVISKSIADKYFGQENPMGKTFKLNNSENFKITGVFNDVPENTHLKFNILISWPTYIVWNGPDIETAWFWDGYYTYILLQKNVDVKAFEKKMNDFTGKQIADRTRQFNQSAKYTLQPLKSIHLNSHLMWEAEVNGDSGMVYFLLLIAFIILIIAWVNYTNLSTVKALLRSKEVGVRKVTGALKSQLVKQFLTESFINN